MIIDFHTHPWMPRRLNGATEAFIRGISPAVAQHGDRLEDPAFAADVLRSEGVHRAVVLPEHCPETSGNVRTGDVLAFCAAAPDFYLPFASINPNLDPDPAALLADYVEAGVRGLKIYPSYQFFTPDEERLYPVYDVCQTAGIPLLVHVGSSVIPGHPPRVLPPPLPRARRPPVPGPACGDGARRTRPLVSGVRRAHGRPTQRLHRRDRTRAVTTAGTFPGAPLPRRAGSVRERLARHAEERGPQCGGRARPGPPR